MSLRIENLTVRYGSVTALGGVSLELQAGEMFFLLGPSGCGKSTLLRAVAGFIEDSAGTIAFGGESLNGVPAHRRDFGMVFQNYALFPHLTVEGNVAFGLEARKVAADEARTRVAEALQLVGLSGYEKRRPGELSGGQQQRVALARALVIRPRLLLLDEPLSNLDAKLRWEMRGEIKRIHQQTKITTLYVTHDQKEALSLADRLAILKDGKIEALGAPRDLYLAPPNRFCAGFLGDLNALDGDVVSADNGRVRVKTALGEVNAAGTASAGAKAAVFCRPERVALLEPHAPAPAGFAAVTQDATVCSAAFLGEHTLYEIDLPGGTRWRCYRTEAAGAKLPEGAQAAVAVAEGAWGLLA